MRESARGSPRVGRIPAVAPVSWWAAAAAVLGGCAGARADRTGIRQDDDDGKSTPVGEQPRWDSADDRRAPARPPSGRPRAADPGAAPVTVDQLIARQGGTVGRRAARRAEPPPEPVPPSRPPLTPEDSAAPRRGFPPVPGAGAPTARPGWPPVPDGTARPLGRGARPPAPLPPPPGNGADPRGVRRSGPLPPLPGRRPPPGDRPEHLRRPGAAGRVARRATATPGRRRLVRVLAALAVVVGLVALYPLGLYFYVDHSMTRVDALATDGAEVLAPQLQTGTTNYLVVGTRVPGEKGAGSIAPLLASVSPDGGRVELVTVPPTALVDTPECRTAAGGLREPRTEALADALLDGGPSCLVRAIQEVSGLRIDHYLDLDLARLPGMVDALGGVPVCVQPSPAVAAASRPLPAGNSTVSGSAAAAYLRPAAADADATGAGVTQRAQQLLTSTLRAAMSRSSMTSPLALARFLDRASGALTVDDGTTLGDLRGLGSSLSSSGANVQRGELPVSKIDYVPAGSDRSYVVLDAAATRTLFDRVIGGKGLAARAAPATQAAGDGAGDAAPSPAAPSPAAAAAQAVPVAPAQVKVDVLNGTSTAGLAGTAADAMRAQGFVVGTVGNAPAAVAQTTVRYGSASAEQARTVAASVPGAVLQADPAAGGAVQLVIGPGYTGVVPVQVAPPSPSVAASSGPSAAATAAAKAPAKAPACT
jgi:LCP family protein required for cell wall assembly